MRPTFLICAVLLVVVPLSVFAHAQEDALREVKAPELRIQKALKGEIRVAEPIWIYGPFPTVVHTCKPEDIYVFQIRYPIEPSSFPESVDAYSDSPAAVPTDCVISAGQLAILDMHPQTGPGFGVGHLIVVVKAFKKGKSSITVEVKTADGGLETIPFAIQVGNQRQKVLHGQGAVTGKK